MARFPETGTSILSATKPVQAKWTNPLPDQTREVEDHMPSVDDQTVARVNLRERGDRQIKDHYDAPAETSNETGMALAAAEKRREIAARLAKAIGQALSNFGAVKMAADLALLKRELSQAHDLLRTLPTEGDFFSIVVLVESALGNRPWREISRQELQALKATLDIGVKEAKVTFDEYNRALRTLNASGWKTGPTLEFGNVEDAPDDDEEPADQ